MKVGIVFINGKVFYFLTKYIYVPVLTYFHLKEGIKFVLLLLLQCFFFFVTSIHIIAQARIVNTVLTSW